MYQAKHISLSRQTSGIPDLINSVIHPDYIENEARILKITYYKTTLVKLIAFYTLSLLTLGLVPLLCLWKTSIYILLKYVPSDPQQAEYLLIEGLDGKVQPAYIQTKIFHLGSEKFLSKNFTYRLYVYFFDKNEGVYKPCQFSLKGKTYNRIFQEIGQGLLSRDEYKKRLVTYGPNSTDVTIKSDLRIILQELLSPFHAFQLFAVVFWLFDGYKIYSWFILAFSLFALTLNFLKIRSNYQALKQKAAYSTKVIVYRPNQELGGNVVHAPEMIKSTFLVPGDLIEIPDGKNMPCDVILLSGTCIMDESMFTGQSFPVIKGALPKSEKVFEESVASQYILYAGTKCLEARKQGTEPQVVGVVLRTGFSTAKGRLIRSFLYSKPENFKFYKDAIKYILAFSIVAALCFFASLQMYLERDKEGTHFVKKALDIVTISVPPALPSCLSLGFFVATMRFALLIGLLIIYRLLKKKIITKAELKVTVAGNVQIACFDKTGTLTKSSLDLYGIKVVSQTESNVFKFQNMLRDKINVLSSTKTNNHLMLELMVTCHCLRKGKDGLSGDPLDLTMFEKTRWQLLPGTDYGKRLYSCQPPADSEKNGYYKEDFELSIIQIFEFNVKQQRMSVIVSDSKEQIQRMFMKGAPEQIKALCQLTTIPADFDQILLKYTQKGFRVLGCATKKIETQVKPSDNLAREFFERDLDFLGFLIFENRLQDASPTIIKELSNANISSVILTGDHPFTAVFVGKQCGIFERSDKIILGTAPSSSKISLHSTDSIEWTWLGSRPQIDTIVDGVDSANSAARSNEDECFGVGLIENTLPSGCENASHDEVIDSIKNDPNVRLVITGEVFRTLRLKFSDEKELYSAILQKTKVYARMRPDEKASVIDEFQKQEKIVAMCGDGPQDCPALKAANVGIAIGEGEASLPASFVSKNLDISCLDILLREGRATLATSFQIFKYMSLYSFIQTFSVVIAYSSSTDIPNGCSLYQDLIIVIPVVLGMTLNLPADNLTRDQPLSALVSPPVILSVAGQSLIQLIFQIINIMNVKSQPWYISPPDLRRIASLQGKALNTKSSYFDTTVLFTLANIQLVAIGVLFSIRHNFRKPFYKNYVFMSIVIIIAILSLVILLGPTPALLELLSLEDLKEDETYKWVIFAIAVGNIITSTLYELFAVDFLSNLWSKIIKKIKARSKERYRR